MILLRRVRDALLDPVRRRQVLSRVAESALPVTGALWVAGVGSVLSLIGLTAATIIAEFLLYELVLEPLGWAGPYWERGPRDGATYSRP